MELFNLVDLCLQIIYMYEPDLTSNNLQCRTKPRILELINNQTNDWNLLFSGSTLSALLKICWLYPLQGGKLHPHKKSWGSRSSNLEYLSIVITPRFTLTGRLVPVKAQSMGQIDLSENYSYPIGILDTI